MYSFTILTYNGIKQLYDTCYTVPVVAVDGDEEAESSGCEALSVFQSLLQNVVGDGGGTREPPGGGGWQLKQGGDTLHARPVGDDLRIDDSLQHQQDSHAAYDVVGLLQLQQHDVARLQIEMKEHVKNE